MQGMVGIRRTVLPAFWDSCPLGVKVLKMNAYSIHRIPCRKNTSDEMVSKCTAGRDLVTI